MKNVPPSVSAYWHKVFAGGGAGDRDAIACAVSASLDPKRPAMILEATDGSVWAAVRPETAHAIGLAETDRVSIQELMTRLARIGLAPHDPDYLFYLPADARPAPDRDKSPRQLTEADRVPFEVFYDAASAQDRDDAWVELDHWAVFGCFEGERLVSAASAYLWDESPLADLGVLTLPDARGKGFAGAVVGSINRFAREQEYEPQYRCQIDNHASVALAKACGLTLFGKWILATDPAAEER